MFFAQHSAPWLHILPWISLHVQLHLRFYLYIPIHYYYAFCLFLRGMGGADVDLLYFAELFWAALCVFFARLAFYLWLTLLSRLLYLHPTPYHRDIRFRFTFYPYVDSYVTLPILHRRRPRKRRLRHYHLALRGMRGTPIRSAETHQPPPETWHCPEQESTFWYDTEQDDLDNHEDDPDVETDVWSNTQECVNMSETHFAAPPAGECFEWTSAKVRQVHVATIGLLDKLGLKRDPTGCSVASYIAQEIKPSAVPIVIDTGCSISVTPFVEDFVTELQPAQEDAMQGLNDSVQVKGIGWVDWTIRDVFNRVSLVRTQAYHVPEARVRLLSTQTYFQEHGKGSILQDHEKVILSTSRGEELSFPYDLGSNLPLMYLDHRSASVGLSQRQVLTLSRSEELDHTCTLLDYNNYNLSKPQKELMLWHQRLGHAGFRWIQTLMRKPKHEVGDNTEPPVLPTKNTSTSRCDPPRCPACQLSKAHRRNPGTQVMHKKPELEMAIRRENLNPGDCISMDQYQGRTPGRLPHTYGKEPPNSKYNGGTVFVDHSSGYIYLHHQVSLRAGDTLQGKHAFEQFADQYGIKLKAFHADNHPFGKTEITDDIKLQDQTISFSGVGAHFQNGVAERAIQTVISWSMCYMMHQLLHWPSCFQDDLWPFALDHAVNVWNHLPQSRSGLSPIELFTRTKWPHHDLISHAKVWGCPVYVLDPTLQDGKRLPKWTPKSHLGMYMGSSPSHSETVARILSLETGYVSAQYHVVYDELFSSVQGTLTEELFDHARWHKLLRLGYSCDVDVDDDEGRPIPFHDHYEQFMGPDHDSDSDHEVESEPLPHPGSLVTDLEFIPPPSLVPEGDPSPEGADVGTSDVDSDMVPVGPDDPPLTHLDPILEEPEVTRPKRPRRRYRKRTNPFHDKVRSGQYRTRRGRLVQPSAHLAGTYAAQHTAQVSRSSKSLHTYQYLANGCSNKKIRARTLLAAHEQGLNWTTELNSIRSFDSKRILHAMYRSLNPKDNVLEDWTPTALAAKGNDADTPTWEQAMNGPNAEGFWEACKVEYDTLTKKGCWDIVKRQSWMNILPGTWAFKIKRYPDGLVKKLKARFCARGDRQIEGVDFFDTFAPVVNWTTVRLLLILTAQLGLATKQVDYTAAFIHADIDLPPDFDEMSKEEQRRQGVYVEMPRGFAKPGHVLKLKKSLYGLRQSPRNFFKFLKDKLERAGFRQAYEVDPCLFISDKVICLTYVDDCVMVAKETSDIDDMLKRLRDLGIEMTEEDDVAGFLGVHIERTKDYVKLTQKGLTKRIIEALQVEELPAVSTPADSVLGKDTEGDPPNCSFNYASVIGMLWYLYGHSRPDLGFAVSQAARFAFAPRRSHELALIRIGQYLKGTMNEGMIMKPMKTDSFQMDVYVDSDFLGLYGTEPRTDPDNVKNRTGYVILLNDCPIVWKSVLSQDFALSTMMAEYYALSTAMREVLPLRDLVKVVAEGCGICSDCLTTFKTTVWEDNMGALTLANLDPGQNTTRSKFYDSKVHWFRSHLKPNQIKVAKIDTKAQRADIFTKSCLRDVFERLRKMLMGW